MSIAPADQSVPFADYAPLPGHFDECFSAAGVPRSAFAPLVDHIRSLGREALDSLVADGAEWVRESGITYNAIEEAGERTRPWELSFIPLVIRDEEWSRLDAGLKQRTRLLEAILDDLLGPQRLLQEKVIPPDAVLRNPEFLRTYHGLPKVGGVRLHVIAADLARAEDGSWWVTADRTRAPSGLGYLVENRIITSRAYPDLIQHSNVHRVASFFMRLRRLFESLAPERNQNPRVAILTPGQKSYRYFEDTYLARYLGYTLVQGRDLAVRSGALNLKTLGGLVPIDVLWRHISDEQCDPLELDPDAVEGVTGLLQTMRTGEVAVANCLGSKLVQSPVLLPFLPAASRLLLGEEPLLPTLPTLWCGDAESRREIFDDLERFVIRRAFNVRGDRPIRPCDLSAAARRELLEELRSRPHQYVAQQPICRSTTPVWRDGRMQPWFVALRTFQIQSSGGVDVLPGGLVRVSPTEDGAESQAGAVQMGQDCWIVADRPVDRTSTLLPSPHEPLKFVRGGAELPSRVAENLFWLGRYSERAEAIARVLRTTLLRLIGEQSSSDIVELPKMVAALAAIGQIEPDHAVTQWKGNFPQIDRVLPESLYQSFRQRGLSASVSAMADMATAVRDRISLDAYRIVHRVDDDLARGAQSGNRTDARLAINRLSRLITGLLAFAGLTQESFTRTLGWRFLQLGRRIERAWQTAELLRATLVDVEKTEIIRRDRPHAAFESRAARSDAAAASPDLQAAASGDADERPILEAVLEATDSIMTYRTRYLLRLDPDATLDLLITDDSNPRSILFQLERIIEVMEPLPTEPGEVGIPYDRRLAMDLLHRVRMAQPTQLAHVSPDGSRRHLETLLESLTAGLPELSDAVAARYLIHTAASQTLTGGR